MTLLTRFTNKARHQQLNVAQILLSAMLIMLVQGCSQTPEAASNEPLSNEQSQQNDAALVPEENDSLVNSSAPADANKDQIVLLKGNQYLQQQQQLTAVIPSNIKNTFDNALRLMNDKQWSAANTLFDEIIAAQPQLSGPYVNKALIAIALDKPLEAQQWLQTALKHAPNNPFAHQIYATTLRQQGKFNEAKTHYQQALSIWPAYPQALLNLAILLEMYQGQLIEARRYYLTYLSVKPEDELVKRYLAAVEIKIKRAGLTPTASSNSSSTTNFKTSNNTSNEMISVGSRIGRISHG